MFRWKQGVARLTVNQGRWKKKKHPTEGGREIINSMGFDLSRLVPRHLVGRLGADVSIGKWREARSPWRDIGTNLCIFNQHVSKGKDAGARQLSALISKRENHSRPGARKIMAKAPIEST